jgi:GNAT superfamily N-acetyltransferase
LLKEKTLYSCKEKMEHLNEEERWIANVSHDNGFFGMDIPQWMLAGKSDRIRVTDDEDRKMKCLAKAIEYEGTRIGFHISLSNPWGIQLKYFFILEEYRHQGHGERFLKKMIDTRAGQLDGGISLATAESNMVKLCHKVGFKMIRICDNKKDLLFRYKE